MFILVLSVFTPQAAAQKTKTRDKKAHNVFFILKTALTKVLLRLIVYIFVCAVSNMYILPALKC